MAPKRQGGCPPLDAVDESFARIQGAERGFLIAGHQPHLGRLAARLLTGDENRVIIDFQPASIACLAKGEPPGSWTLEWLIRPDAP